VGASVTSKGIDGLMQACVDWKPMQILAVMRSISLKKNSKESIELKLIFDRHNIRFRPTRCGSATPVQQLRRLDSLVLWRHSSWISG
jgi:hypothetical protein